MNLEISTLNISSIILKELAKSKVIKYNALLDKLLQKNGDDAKFNFTNALGLLFLLGKIEYHKKTDSFEFKK
jgi:hypothetical protein